MVVTDDFNQWKVEDSLADYPNIKEVDIGPTRGTKKIYRMFVNFS